MTRSSSRRARVESRVAGIGSEARAAKTRRIRRSLATMERLEDRRLLATVGDLVFSDVNANGIFDGSDLGVDGVTVNLFNAGADGQIGGGDDAAAGTTMTAGGGLYTFAGVAAGTFYAQFVLPTGSAFTLRDQGGNDLADSDADRATGNSPVFTLGASDVNNSIDAGLLLPNVVTTASGTMPSDIQATVDSFRAALGTLNANVAGSFGQGRREINWDGVPDSFSSPTNLPADFFNVNSPRGAVFSTPGSGFLVSQDDDTGADADPDLVRFSEIDASYAAQFQTFSPQRLFTAVGSNVTNVNFFVPGSTMPATVTAFGAVFTDVESGTSTSIEYFDSAGVSLGRFFAPTSASGGLSFLGVSYGNAPVIASVRITSGDTALGAAEGTNDLVVMDDFLYGEPQTPPVFQFSAAEFNAGEAGGAVNVAITRSGGLTVPVTITFSTNDATATGGADYTDSDQTVTFNPGETSRLISVPILDDALAEDVEVIRLSLSNPSTGSVGSQATSSIVIADDELPAANALGLATVSGTQSLVRFNTANPGTILATVPISGLQASETLLGIDFRPANGMLYGLGSTSRLYTIDTNTGAATQVGTGTFAVALNGTSFGFDFNPVPDRIRVTSDANQNLRLHPDTGAVVDFDAATPGLQTDLDLAYAAGDANAGQDPNVAASAYINNFAGTTTTTLFGIDTNLNILVTQSPPNNGVLNTVGALGVDVDAVLGFDIRPANNTALAAMVVGGSPGLYSINLSTGQATLIGPISGGLGLSGLAIVPNGTFRFSASSYTVNENGASVTITVNRIGGSDGTVAVNFATSDLTAVAGMDYSTLVGTLTFGPGITSRTFTVAITDDTLPEDLEAIGLTLSAPTGGGVIGSPSTASIIIADDEILPANASGILGGTTLVRFNTATPGTIISSLPITGLQTGETILALDYRPATGELYGLGSTSRIYVLNPGTGAATAIGSGTFTPALSGASFGFDFNPTVDRIRLVSDLRQNLRLNPITGTVAATDTNLVYAVGDPNAAATPNVVGAAYINNFTGSTTTTLFDIDTNLDILVTQNPPNSGVLNTVGSLGVDVSAVLGFDIRTSSGQNIAYASMVVGTTTSLYTINLTTGQATLLGPIGSAIQALAVAPDALTATLTGTTATFNGAAASEPLAITASGGFLQHNRFTAGDPGFNSSFDFDSAVPGDQTLSASDPTVVINYNGGAGDDRLIVGDSNTTAASLVATFNFDGGGGNDEVQVDDSADATGRTATVGDASITGLGGPVNIVAGVDSIVVLFGTNTDVANITATGAIPTIIRLGDGDDTAAFADGASIQGLLDGGSGTNSLDYSAYSSTVNVDLSVTQTLFLARLSATQEPGPLSNSTGSGNGVFVLDNAQTSLSFQVDSVVVGATLTGQHFHNAPAGVNGGIVRGVNVSEGDGTPNTAGAWTSTDPVGSPTATSGPLTSTLVAELLANRIYYNVHTNLFPAGEIRGQLINQGTVNPATGASGVTGFTNVQGGSASDTLTGSSGVNVLRGGGGDDVIVGRQGNDSMFGEDGQDLLIWNNGDGSDLFEGGPDDDTAQVNGSTLGGDAFFVQANGARIAFARTNLGLFSLDIGTTEALDFNTLGGDDTTTVDFAAGNPIPVNGIDFDGGDGADLLVLQGNLPVLPFQNEVYTATGPGAGVITLDGSFINFSSLDPVNDTTAAVNFTFNSPAGPQDVRFGVGPVISGFQTIQISSGDTPAGFELINFANKTNVAINTNDDENVVNINSSTNANGLTSLTINTLGGVDQVNLTAIPAGVAVTANTGTGADVVSVAIGGVGAGASVNLDGGTNIDSLFVNAGGFAPTITGSSVAANGVTVNHANFENVTVSNAAGTALVPVSPAPTISAVEGSGVIDIVVARFTDADPGAVAGDYRATIDWGDGTSSVGSVTADASNPAVFNVRGSHVYQNQGSFTVTVTIVDDGGRNVSISGQTTTTTLFNAEAPVTATSTASVSDAPITATGVPVVAVENVSGTFTVATFTTSDTNAAVGDFTANIAWGDGTSSTGTVTVAGTTPNGVTFSVSGSHTYANPGVFTVNTSIVSLGGSVGVANGSATVQDAPLSATFTAFSPTEEVSANFLVATFTDAGGPEAVNTYSATIDWGDGSPRSNGQITLSGTTFSVRGTHVYDESGAYSVTVTIDNNLGTRAIATGSISVADVPIVITGGLAQASDTGVSSTDGITRDNTPDFIGTSEDGSIVTLRLARVDNPTIVVTPFPAVTDAAGVWRLNAGLLADGAYTVTATAVDRNGVTTATASLGTVVIDTVGPQITALGLTPVNGEFTVTFIDAGGLDQATLNDLDNYDVSRPLSPRRTPVSITSITTVATAPGTPQGVVLQTNGGRRITHGRFLVAVLSGGVSDLAGNALDGEYVRTLPSGNGVPGGDFLARIDFNGRRVVGPRPVAPPRGAVVRGATTTPAKRVASPSAIDPADQALGEALASIDVKKVAKNAKKAK